MGRGWARVGVLEGRARARSLPVLVNSPRRPHPARFWSSVGASIPAGGVSIACAGRLRIAEPKGAAGAAQWAKQGVTFCPPRTSLAPAPAPAAAADTCWPIMWLMRRAARGAGLRAARGAGLRAARGGVTLSKRRSVRREESRWELTECAECQCRRLAWRRFLGSRVVPCWFGDRVMGP